MLIRPTSRRTLAAVAFLFHAPGLSVLTGYRVALGVLAFNALAILLTAIGMLAVAVHSSVAEDAISWRGVFIAWLIGHFAWSLVLASIV